MILGWWYQYAFVTWGYQEVSKLDFKTNHNKQYICLTCIKSLFWYIRIWIYMSLSAHVFMWCVVMYWAWLYTWAYVRMMVHWHEHENALSFLWMRKWILVNEISVLCDFALGAASWSCVGATSWDYAEATSWGPERRKVPRMVQNATHSAKCHAQHKVPQLQNMYFIERKWESLKATKRDFYEFVLQYF